MARTSSSRLIHNTMLNVAAHALHAVVGFVLVGFFLRTIGEEGYGVWVLIGSVFSYRQLMTMGLNSAITRYIPWHLANDDHAAVRQVVSTAFAYFTLLALILAGSAVLVSVHLDEWLTIPAEFVSDARWLTLIVGFTFAFGMPLQVYQAFLGSYQRYDLINYPLVIAILVRTALIIQLLGNGHGLVTLGLIYAASEVFIRLSTVVFSYGISGGLQLSPASLSMDVFKQMFGYGMNTLLYVTGALIVLQLAEFVLGIFVSATAVSRFHVAAMPVLLLITSIQVLAGAMKPAVSDLDARDEHGRIENMALLAQKYTGVVIVLGVSFLIVMGEPFLQIWVGARYDDPAAIVELSAILTALACGSGTRLTQHSNFIVLVGKGDHRFFGIIGFLTVACGLGAALFSVLALDGGAVSVAWASAIPMIAFSSTVLPIHFMREMKVPLRSALHASWLPVVWAASPGLTVLVAWRAVHVPDSWPELLLSGAAAVTATAASGLLFSTTPSERRRLRATLLRQPPAA